MDEGYEVKIAGWSVHFTCHCGTEMGMGRHDQESDTLTCNTCGRVWEVGPMKAVEINAGGRNPGEPTTEEIIEAGNPMAPDLGAPIGWFNKKEHRKMGG